MSDFFIPDGRNVTNHTDVDRNQFCAAVSAENGGGSPSVCKVVRNDRGHILSGLRDALRHDTVIGAESHEGFSIQFHICRTNTARDFCDTASVSAGRIFATVSSNNDVIVQALSVKGQQLLPLCLQ